VRIAHLIPYQWSGFIYAAIYSCFLPVAYQVSFSGMVVVHDAHTAILIGWRECYILSQVVHMLFVPDIFALKRMNGIEKISRYSDFDR